MQPYMACCRSSSSRISRGGRWPRSSPPRRRWRCCSWPARRGSLSARRLLPWLPALVIVVAWRLAVYALLLPRSRGGRCADHDAIALRSFGWYVTPLGLAAAIVGYVLAVRRWLRATRSSCSTLTIFAAVLLLQDPHRPRALLDDAALPAGDPARRAAARRLCRVRPLATARSRADAPSQPGRERRWRRATRIAVAASSS